MSLPERARDLIQLEAGAPEFRVKLWWDSFKEGRLFYPKGFAHALALLDIEGIGSLTKGDYLAKAAKYVAEKTEWTEQLGGVRIWEPCSNNQFGWAADEAPMLLSKAAQCMVALHLFAQDRPSKRDINVFEKIKLVPGVYAVVGLSFTALNALKQAGHPSLEGFDKAARPLGQGRSRDILWDVSRSQEHVPYSIAMLIKKHFDGVNDMNIEVVLGSRPAGAGIAPASASVQP